MKVAFPGILRKSPYNLSSKNVTIIWANVGHELKFNSTSQQIATANLKGTSGTDTYVMHGIFDECPKPKASHTSHDRLKQTDTFLLDCIPTKGPLCINTRRLVLRGYVDVR
eukprot:5772799-Amphidinium_carterae.2